LHADKSSRLNLNIEDPLSPGFAARTPGFFQLRGQLPDRHIIWLDPLTVRLSGQEGQELVAAEA